MQCSVDGCNVTDCEVHNQSSRSGNSLEQPQEQHQHQQEQRQEHTQQTPSPTSTTNTDNNQAEQLPLQQFQQELSRQSEQEHTQQTQQHQQEHKQTQQQPQNQQSVAIHISPQQQTPVETEAGNTPGSILQYQAFSSAVDVSFWRALAQKKLDEYKLSDSPQALFGHYSPSRHATVPASFNVGDYSFHPTLTLPPDACLSPIVLLNCNTMESFKSADKAALLQRQGDALWGDITSGRALQSPLLLSRVFLLTFAMIKEHRYYYWFAFPALNPPRLTVEIQSPVAPLSSLLSPPRLSSFAQAFQAFKANDKDGVGFFLVTVVDDVTQVHPLGSYEQLAKEGEVMLGFVDPCPLPTNPGWPLRNFLLLAAHSFGMKQATVIGYRTDVHSSIALSVKISYEAQEQPYKTVGWEKKANKLVPRVMDLQPFMDPSKLAEASVDLNIKLMRWRALPSLSMEVVNTTKVLLLGAGTLGCNVARCLLGWGIRHLTFVDNGKVSYSNPVRQSLYGFEDCLAGGQPKAACAAQSVKKIFPGVVSEGVTLSIPMPGHLLEDSQVADFTKAISTLEALVDAHDVVFLLTDSRESRWLPSLLCAARNKLLMNAALGFDSFVVMRHGARSEDAKKPELGCYFCNDVVAPMDSLRDRTLDQQCTVTRPGLAYIASALAVEMTVSILHHPSRELAPAQTPADDASFGFGIVPHQVRGSLPVFNMTVFTGHAFDRCTACSTAIVHEYQQNGMDFLLRAMRNPKVLEDVSGLTMMKKETEALLEAISDDGLTDDEF